MPEKVISRAVIRRLPRYYRYLNELQYEGVERISSGQLSKLMNVTASQIRQDLNNFGGFGQQGYGYNVAHLKEEIGKILYLDKVHNMIIVGGGNFGHALAGYRRFEEKNFIIRAVFDVDKSLIGTDIRGIPILDVAELPAYLAEHPTDIAILTVPKSVAQDVTDILVANGIKGIMNFAHLDLEVPDDVTVESIHLSENMMELSYRLGERR